MSDSGLLLIDKPEGPSSHDVVDAVRRKIGYRTVGHTGTLDPMASGLLLICIGKMTRLAEYLVGHDKEYLAGVSLGTTTNTFDATGKVLETCGVATDKPSVQRILARFLGSTLQRPPSFSAVRIEGQRAYKLARQGREVNLDERPVEVHRLELVHFDPPDLTLDVRCSAGTYVRSLAHDLGQALGCGAHLSRLRRTACGPFSVEQALKLEALAESDSWRDFLLPPAEALTGLPTLRLTHDEAELLGHGRMVPFRDGARPEADDERTYRAVRENGELLAVVLPDHEGGVFRPRKVLG
ncbi:MAG: tRNA pseudouridine(55) synthase TruB [Planctomycetota bacterium]